nr:peptidoglycan DD-metalloendopeptidase family protein [Luteithermobacter gelatinilyticus]
MRELSARYFPERQMYFRTNGVVRFVTLSERTQLLIAAGLFGLACWLVFASVFVTMESKILAAKDAEVREALRQYELMEQQFNTLKSDIEETARNLEQRQIYLQQLMETEKALGILPMQETLEGQGQEHDPQLPAGEENTEQTISFEFGSPHQEAEFAARNEELRDLSFNLKRLEQQQRNFAEVMIRKIAAKLDYIDKTLEKSGVPSDRLIEVIKDRPSLLAEAPVLSGQGGPLIVFSDHIDAEMLPDEPFARLQAHYNRLIDLEAAIQNMPVTKPVRKYYISSGFGVRKDPFKKTWARHYGVDMAGWWKTPIYATAAGVVTKAGRNGAYGNFIEIDHGNGFKSRYGHLSKIKVKRGQQVSMDQEIGLMGSTGRSTSPHLHYEIWFNGKAINPLKLFKAAEDVLKIQRQDYDRRSTS